MQSRRTLTEHERRVVAYHEGGHALWASCCRPWTPSTGSRSSPAGSALGYTLNLPEEDRYLKTREELIDMMTMLLGRPCRRGAGVRLDHHRRRRRSAARGRHRPRDGARVRDGHRHHLAAHGRPTASRMRPGGSATRRCASWPTRPSGRRWRSRLAPAAARRDGRHAAGQGGHRARATSIGSWRGIPTRPPRSPARRAPGAGRGHRVEPARPTASELD